MDIAFSEAQGFQLFFLLRRYSIMLCLLALSQTIISLAASTSTKRERKKEKLRKFQWRTKINAHHSTQTRNSILLITTIETILKNK